MQAGPMIPPASAFGQRVRRSLTGAPAMAVFDRGPRRCGILGDP